MPTLHDYYTELGHVNDAIQLLSALRTKLTLPEDALLRLPPSERQTVLELTQCYFTHAQAGNNRSINSSNAKDQCATLLSTCLHQLTITQQGLEGVIRMTTGQPQLFTNPCLIEINEAGGESSRTNPTLSPPAPSARAIQAALEHKQNPNMYASAREILNQVKKDLASLKSVLEGLKIIAQLRQLSSELIQTESSFLMPFLLLKDTADESIRWIEAQNTVTLSTEERRVIESFFALKDRIHNPLLFTSDEMQAWSRDLRHGQHILQRKLASLDYQNHVKTNIPLFIRLNSAFIQMRQKLQHEPKFNLGGSETKSSNARVAFSESQKKTLSELLIFPVQRLPRYRLLFNGMIEQLNLVNHHSIFQLCEVSFSKESIEAAATTVCDKLEKLNREQACLEKSIQLSSQQFLSAQFLWDALHKGLHLSYPVDLLSQSAEEQTLRALRQRSFDTLANDAYQAEIKASSKDDKQRIRVFLNALRLSRQFNEDLEFTAEEFVAAYKAYHQDPLEFLFRWHGFKKACSITSMSVGTITVLIGIISLASLLTGPLAPVVASIGISTTLAVAGLAGGTVAGTALTLLGYGLLPTLPNQSEVKKISSVMHSTVPSLPERDSFHKTSRNLGGFTHSLHSNATPLAPSR